jgi:hypothetical protein
MAIYTRAPNGLRMVNGMYSMNTRRGISMRIIGTKNVQEALNKKLAQIKGASISGLLKAAAFLREDMDRTPPLIPVDTGNMRARYRTYPVPEINTNKVTVIAGWPAVSKDEYAPYVHEMTQPPYENEINWSRPGSGPKFFEAAVKRNTNNFVQIVANNVKPVI